MASTNREIIDYIKAKKELARMAGTLRLSVKDLDRSIQLILGARGVEDVILNAPARYRYAVLKIAAHPLSGKKRISDLEVIQSGESTKYQVARYIMGNNSRGKIPDRFSLTISDPTRERPISQSDSLTGTDPELAPARLVEMLAAAHQYTPFQVPKSEVKVVTLQRRKIVLGNI